MLVLFFLIRALLKQYRQNAVSENQTTLVSSTSAGEREPENALSDAASGAKKNTV